MPHIEILPNSTSTSAPGWAYVPDTGPDPSRLAIQPSGTRKRAGARASHPGAESSTRQTNAVLKHLAELDRDGHRDVVIAVAGKGPAGRVSKAGKPPPQIRRILASQKSFANHLADEEAARAAPLPPAAASTPRACAPRPPALPAVELAANSLLGAPGTEDGADPLLRSYGPGAPAVAVMEALVAAPALAYNAARAGAAGGGRPQRRFCEICGFWGRGRCGRCGARVCGVECMGVHEEGRCLKFYA